MKLEKIMSNLFYILTIGFSIVSIGFFMNIYGTLFGFILLIFYISTYYCYTSYKNYILKKYYIEKDKDNREPDVAMIEDFYHGLGFVGYKCQPKHKKNLKKPN